MMSSYSICLSLCDLFHLFQCPPVSSMLSHMTGFPSFLRLNNNPLHIYTFYPFICQLTLRLFLCLSYCEYCYGWGEWSGGQITLWDSDLISFRKIPRSGLAKSCVMRTFHYFPLTHPIPPTNLPSSNPPFVS